MNFRESPSCSTKNFAKFCMKTKKAQIVAFIHVRLCMPKNDKHKRPTPQTGCCPWPYDQRPTKSRYDKLKHTAKRHTCVSVRLVLILLKFAHFTWRARAKTLLLFKNNIKKSEKNINVYKKKCFFEKIKKIAIL